MSTVGAAPERMALCGAYFPLHDASQLLGRALRAIVTSVHPCETRQRAGTGGCLCCGQPAVAGTVPEAGDPCSRGTTCCFVQIN